MDKCLKYTANFYFDEDNVLLDAEACEGTVESIDDKGIVKFKCVLRGKKQTVELSEKNIFHSRKDAEKKVQSALAWKERKMLKQAVQGNTGFLPEILEEPNAPYFSGNPLRFGEPMMMFTAQTNAWGKEDNPQKILQIAGAIWEDIEMLQGMLFVLGFANNYSKKLIGKYIVIELNSLFLCLKRLSDFDKYYKEGLFLILLEEMESLDKEYKFRLIRNKISAHRDTNIDLMDSTLFWNKITRHSISRYIESFSNHLVGLIDHYPFEISSYFLMRKKKLEGMLAGIDNDEYQAFDEPFKGEP